MEPPESSMDVGVEGLIEAPEWGELIGGGVGVRIYPQGLPE